MRIEQLKTPALIIDLDILEKNQNLMDELVSKGNAKLRPHYKSHKCVRIAQIQLEHGAKGITCAKLSEAVDLAEAGIEDILIANEIRDKARIAEAASLSNCCHLGIAVDTVENILDLEAAASVQDAVIYVLAEYEIGMGRCGVSTLEELYELAKTVHECPHLVFEGIQAYAGQLSHEVSPDVRVDKGCAIEKKLKEAREYLETRGLEVHQISGCSTASVCDHAFPGSVYTEYQAGSYLFMDASYGLLKDLKFENSLFLLTSVLSQAGGNLILDGGRKSISMDQHDPVVVGFENDMAEFSEEHTTIINPSQNLCIGDRVRLIPGHCCTCMNMHDHVYLIRGGKVVDKVPITSRGRSL